MGPAKPTKHGGGANAPLSDVTPAQTSSAAVGAIARALLLSAARRLCALGYAPVDVAFRRLISRSFTTWVPFGTPGGDPLGPVADCPLTHIA
jgi:hypothetical protein